MKLLMISGDRSVPTGKRGAFYYTLEEFSKHWDRVDILCPHVSHPAPSPFGNVYFHISPHSLLRQPGWILQKGRDLIAEHGHAVAAVHEYPPFYNGIGAARLHRMTHIPYVLEVHHIVGYPRPASAAERAGKFLSRLFLARDARTAASVRVVNGETGRILTSFGVPPHKIHIVPSFYLDASVFYPDLAVRKTFDLVFCARLVPNKGLLPLLAALKTVRGSLLIIGEGPERARAERYISANGLSGRVTFTGWLNGQEDVAAKLRLAKVFVMNSFSEGGPRVALEAMACGLPVIATKVGVLPDVIKDGENGIFTDGTAMDLAIKIRALLDDEQKLRRLGDKASRIIERFERTRLIQEYAEFLKAAAHTRRISLHS